MPGQFGSLFFLLLAQFVFQQKSFIASLKCHKLLGMVVCAFNPSYSGGLSRRMDVRGKLWAKSMKPYLKNNCAKRTGRGSRVECLVHSLEFKPQYGKIYIHYMCDAHIHTHIQ
jgi:hypothetical protein